jgi:hypothetical protein
LSIGWWQFSLASLGKQIVYYRHGPTTRSGRCGCFGPQRKSKVVAHLVQVTESGSACYGTNACPKIRHRIIVALAAVSDIAF